MNTQQVVEKDVVVATGMGMRKLAKAVKDTAGIKLGRTDIYVAPFELLYVESGFNIRDIDWERVEFFKKMYIEGRALPPIDVQPVEVNGVNKLKVLDGHHRYYGLEKAIQEGYEIRGSRVNEIAGNSGDVLFHMIGTTQGRPLSAIERSRAYGRLINQGYTQSEIAERLNQSQASVSNSLLLIKADKQLQDMIQNGVIGVSRALELIRQYGTERATQAAILDVQPSTEETNNDGAVIEGEVISKSINGEENPTVVPVKAQPKKRRSSGLKTRSLGKKSVLNMSEAVRTMSTSLEAQLETSGDEENLTVEIPRSTALKLLSLVAELEEIDVHNTDVEKKLTELAMQAKESVNAA